MPTDFLECDDNGEFQCLDPESFVAAEPPRTGDGSITEKQKQILELAYGSERPDFSRPPQMTAKEIAKITGAGLAYVKNILRDKYLRKRNIKYLFHKSLQQVKVEE